MTQPIPVVVLCGGHGTRLGYPGQKCLIETAGRPFLHHKLDQLADRGATHFYLLVAHCWWDVVHAVGMTWQDIPVTYSLDSGESREQARAQAALPFVYWLTYGDSILDVRLTHSKLPYVYVNDEYPYDAGVSYCWGQNTRWLPRYTTEPAIQINTPGAHTDADTYLRRRASRQQR